MHFYVRLDGSMVVCVYIRFIHKNNRVYGDQVCSISPALESLLFNCSRRRLNGSNLIYGLWINALLLLAFNQHSKTTISLDTSWPLDLFWHKGRKLTTALALSTDSLLLRSSLGGSDQRNRDSLSTSPDCCNASQTQAICSGEKHIDSPSCGTLLAESIDKNNQWNK